MGRGGGGGGGGGGSETASDIVTRHNVVRYSLIQGSIQVEETA